VHVAMHSVVIAFSPTFSYLDISKGCCFAYFKHVTTMISMLYSIRLFYCLDTTLSICMRFSGTGVSSGLVFYTIMEYIVMW